MADQSRASNAGGLNQVFNPQSLETTLNTSVRGKQKRSLETVQSMLLETAAMADRKQDCPMLRG